MKSKTNLKIKTKIKVINNYNCGEDKFTKQFKDNEVVILSDDLEMLRWKSLEKLPIGFKLNISLKSLELCSLKVLPADFRLNMNLKYLELPDLIEIEGDFVCNENLTFLDLQSLQKLPFIFILNDKLESLLLGMDTLPAGVILPKSLRRLVLNETEIDGDELIEFIKKQNSKGGN